MAHGSLNLCVYSAHCITMHACSSYMSNVVSPIVFFIYSISESEPIHSTSTMSTDVDSGHLLPDYSFEGSSNPCEDSGIGLGEHCTEPHAGSDLDSTNQQLRVAFCNSSVIPITLHARIISQDLIPQPVISPNISQVLYILAMLFQSTC